MLISRHLLLRRSLFVSITLCIPCLIYLLTIQPALSLLSAQADRLTQARAALSRYRAMAAQEEAVRNAAAQVEMAGSSAAFLQGTSDGAINADLQARLKAIADQAGARVQSIRALPPTIEGDLRYLRAHVELSGPLAAIYATLQAIEGRRPYLFVGAAVLRMPSSLPNISAAQEPLIEEQFDIYGPGRSHVAGR